MRFTAQLTHPEHLTILRCLMYRLKAIVGSLVFRVVDLVKSCASLGDHAA